MLRLMASARSMFNLITSLCYDRVVKSAGYLILSRSRESNVPTANGKALFALRILRLQTQLA
jgi:hypothetical protein